MLETGQKLKNKFSFVTIDINVQVDQFRTHPMTTISQTEKQLIFFPFQGVKI